MAAPNLTTALVVLLLAFVRIQSTHLTAAADKQNQNEPPPPPGKNRKLLDGGGDLSAGKLWPNRQLNVLIDLKSLNETEQQMVGAIFDQIEHKTCVKVNRLPADRVNPFAPAARQLANSGRNFIYIFKSHVGLYNRPPSIGLSTFGCAQKGRQSMVLTDLAFRWPQHVLRYHALRSLAVPNLSKPTELVEQLEARQLPLSQKIINSTGDASLGPADDESPTYFAFAARPPLNDHDNDDDKRATAAAAAASNGVQYLNDDDLNEIKQLYDCSDYQNRLSVKPLSELGTNQLHPNEAATATSIPQQQQQPAAATTTSSTSWPEQESLQAAAAGGAASESKLTAKKLKNAEESLRQIINLVAEEKGAKLDDSLVENAAKSIVHYLLSELENGMPNSSTSSGGGDDLAKDSQAIESLFDSFESLNSSSDSSKPGNGCKPLESCPIKQTAEEGRPKKQHQERSTPPFEGNNQPASQDELQRPMLLKLDPFHAMDPQLKQANQMKLSQVPNATGESAAAAVAADTQTYRLLSGPQQQQQRQQSLFDSSQQQQQAKGGGKSSEMLISFEQTPDSAATGGQSAIASLASSQVLKLCSCTCQTMTPSSPPPPPPPPTSTEPRPQPTEWPPFTDYQSSSYTPPYTQTVTDWPSWPTSTGSSSTGRPSGPATTFEPTNTDPWLPPWTMTPFNPDDTFTYAPTFASTNAPTSTTTTTTTTTSTTLSSPKPTTASTPKPTTTSTTTTTTTTSSPVTTTDYEITTTQAPATTSSASTGWPLNGSACDQVEWVKPNKTIYSSAKIVWDVDRANQNYFLCNNLVNGELVPGKTHGLSCKVSSEGKAYEMHNFSVLIKPESVQLAWVQRNSQSFGSKNLPVIGGYSKASDPYVVSRCLVRDENNDVITLIGYINSQNVGWFPFDDIQIECSQYDVLACVN